MTATDLLDPTAPDSGAPHPLVAIEPVVRRSSAEARRAACSRIAPLWPLDHFVAVNPYLGLTERSFAEAAELLASTAGARSTMPPEHYLAAFDAGRIARADLAAALAAHRPERPVDVDAFLAEARAAGGDEARAWTARVPTVADVASECTGRDWVRLCTDRVATWAACYFDEGQAMWRSADQGEPLFASWKAEAAIDRTPEVQGLRRFRAAVRALPDDPAAASDQALTALGLLGPDGVVPGTERYLHRLLLRVGGWSAHVARLAFEHRLAGSGDDGRPLELLAVLLGWEASLLATASPDVASAWAMARADLEALGDTPRVRAAVSRRLVLQEALDRSEQRRLAERVSMAAAPTSGDDARPAAERPAAQAVFCIDVRSEVFRRHLEAVAPAVETLGFAGFFGMPVAYVPIAHEHGGAHCPVLLTPAHTVREVVDDPEAQQRAVESRRLSHHVRRAWKSFKMGAITCFSFVGPVGLAYLPKLVTDAHGLTRPVPRPDVEGLPRSVRSARHPGVISTPDAAAGIALADRVELAAGALRAMSLTAGFARLVLVAGHGSTTVNNPYGAGLDCGACGGRTGEASARVAVAILNDRDVRRALVQKGIVIPADTWFVAGQHDTTTDHVALFERDAVPASHAAALGELEAHLEAAGAGARAERARRLGIEPADDVDRAVIGRSADWAQVRPEWGLAGCRAFVIAPRQRTAGVDLGGQVFLHSYDWRRDEGFGVLELLMTAPMVVASWICLQYYASTVDNEHLGAGNKTLHNVVGKLGVVEGAGGDLRVGLPWQSVHDGERFQHEPLRLNVVIEAPLAAIEGVLVAHPDVRALCDNGWVQLHAIDDAGVVSHRYAGDLRWEPVRPAA